MIRVFSVVTGDKLYTFSRGLKTATQYSLSFSKNSAFLLSSSDTGTIHLYQLEDPENADISRGNTSIVDE
jgi:autophagy-related protein 18